MGKPKEVIAKLYAAHSEGKTNMGFDIEGDSGEIKDCVESEVFDLLIAKSGRSNTLSTLLARFLEWTRSSWLSVLEVQSRETQAEEWTRTTTKPKKTLKLGTFTLPLCICEMYLWMVS